MINSFCVSQREMAEPNNSRCQATLHVRLAIMHNSWFSIMIFTWPPHSSDTSTSDVLLTVLICLSLSCHFINANFSSLRYDLQNCQLCVLFPHVFNLQDEKDCDCAVWSCYHCSLYYKHFNPSWDFWSQWVLEVTGQNHCSISYQPVTVQDSVLYLSYLISHL